jgi:2-iminobutanoate/2-iminopropanoate deaminase
VKRRVARPGDSDAKTAGISHACVGDDAVYVSGQVSTAATLQAQVEEAWAGVVGLVEAAGGSARDVTDLAVFVCGDSPDPRRSVLSAAWRALQPLVDASVGEPPPAVTVVQVVALARPAMQIEIKAVAHLGAGGAPA